MVIDDVVLDITVARHALQKIDEIPTLSFFRNVDDFLLEFVKFILFGLSMRAVPLTPSSVLVMPKPRKRNEEIHNEEAQNKESF